MALDRFVLDWNLDKSNKWKVVRKSGDGGGVDKGDTVELTGSRTGVNVNVISKAAPWGTGTHLGDSDKVQGTTNFTGSTRPINIRHTICLICTVKMTADPTTWTTWVARLDPNKDVYQRYWMLGREWQVAASNVDPPIDQDSVVTFEGAALKKVKMDGIEWGYDCSYTVSLDEMTGKRKLDDKSITIIRRPALMCQLDGSGGNSWVAVEGGMP